MLKISHRNLSALICATLSINTIVGASESNLERKQFQINTHKLEAELALSAEERQRGLMFREALAENQGMMFQFTHADYYCMWMKNTLIPLSIAFIDEKGRIINIEEMQANSEQTTCAKAKARYALEMNSNWYSQRQIKAGEKVDGLPLENRVR